MAKYFGYKSREEFIDDMYEGDVSFRYKDSSYIFTLDGRGYNCIPKIIDDKPLNTDEMIKMTASADTVEELIDKVVFSDGVTLNEALEMDESEFS